MPATTEVFLSPRVIDQAAFDDLASSLRETVESAVGRAGDLASAVQAAEATVKRLSAASAILTTAEARATEAAAFYAKAADLAERATHAQLRAEQAVRDRIAAAERTVAEFEARVGQAVARLASLDSRAIVPLTELCTRAETLIGAGDASTPGTLAEVLERTQRAGAKARAAARDLDQIRHQAEHTRALLADAVLAGAKAADAASR